VVAGLQRALDEMDDKTIENESSASYKTSPDNNKPRQASFILYIKAPHERSSDCSHVIEAIGLNNDKTPVQTLTSPSRVGAHFRAIDDIVFFMLIIAFKGIT